MESISSNANPSASKVVRASERIVSRAKGESKPEEMNCTKLRDFNGLAERVDSSGSTIRSEAVERGKALISDPNWPNDSLLDDLAETLLEEEEFGS